MLQKLIFHDGDKKFWAKRAIEKEENTRKRSNIFFMVSKLMIGSLFSDKAHCQLPLFY
jgi:hypothetical protein